MGTTKIIAGYSHMCEKMSTCLVLLLDKMLMVAFGSCIVTHIIDLLMRALLSLVVELLCLCSTVEKVSVSSVFFVSDRFISLQVSRLVAQLMV